MCTTDSVQQPSPSHSQAPYPAVLDVSELFKEINATLEQQLHKMSSEINSSRGVSLKKYGMTACTDAEGYPPTSSSRQLLGSIAGHLTSPSESRVSVCRMVSSDYVIASTTSLCNGEPPNIIHWDQKLMWDNLSKSFEQGKIKPLPGCELHDCTQKKKKKKQLRSSKSKCTAHAGCHKIVRRWLSALSAMTGFIRLVRRLLLLYLRKNFVILVHLHDILQL